MTDHAQQRKTWKTGLLIALIPALLLSFSCKGATDPEVLANIIAQNLCGASVDVYLDGVFKFSVQHATDETIQDLPLGTYSLEARKTGGDAVVKTDSIEVAQSLNYVWVIEGASVIVVENKYGESLNIVMNGTLIAQIPDQEGIAIPKVAFGTHEMAAYRTSDGIIVAQTTFEVEDVGEYLWTIEKPATR